MALPDYSISTPENVDLHLELAGLGNRILAVLIDTAICGAVILAVGITLVLINTLIGTAGLPESARNMTMGIMFMIGILATFFIGFGYYIFFEGTWQGQTPGKRMVHIRVIYANGQPASWSAVFIRNIVRVFDQYVLMVGLISMIVDKNERRFGDLLAGTLVIRERLSEFSTANIALTHQIDPNDTLDVGRITPQEYDLLVNFLRRRNQLASTQRPVVAKQLDDYFHQKLEEPMIADHNAEEFLERVFSVYQNRAHS